MQKYTDEEKKAYFAGLRKQWNEAKELAETDEMKGICKEVERMGFEPSPNSIAFVYANMQALGLEGLPYIDTKTFNKWQEAGFQVKKGEKSKVSSLTFISVEKEDEDSFRFPKVTKLFHRTQVDPIK